MVLAQQGQTLDWFSLATTLVATLVGGLLAVATSVVVRRWELRQSTRVRMFDELLPELGRSYHGWLETHQDKLGTPVGKEAENAATNLYRAAVIAGKQELLIVEPIRRLMRDRLKANNLERAHAIDQPSRSGSMILSGISQKGLARLDSTVSTCMPCHPHQFTMPSVTLHGTASAVLSLDPPIGLGV